MQQSVLWGVLCLGEEVAMVGAGGFSHPPSTFLSRIWEIPPHPHVLDALCPTDKPAAEEDEGPGSHTPYKMIQTIGLSVGAAVAYIIIVLGLMFYCKKRRKAKRLKKHPEGEEPEMECLNGEAGTPEAGGCPAGPCAAGAEGRGLPGNRMAPNPWSLTLVFDWWQTPVKWWSAVEFAVPNSLDLPIHAPHKGICPPSQFSSTQPCPDHVQVAVRAWQNITAVLASWFSPCIGTLNRATCRREVWLWGSS